MSGSAPGTSRSQGELLWSGEHWIAYLRAQDGAETGAVSLYYAYSSPAGAGTVAFVSIPARDSHQLFTAVCTDNREFASFARDSLVVRRVSPIDPDAEVVDAKLQRSGDIRQRPGWTIRSRDRLVHAEWGALQPAIVGPPVASKSIVFTILVFADEGSITLDGSGVTGAHYPREGWVSSLGEAKSSFCFALAETMVAESTAPRS